MEGAKMRQPFMFIACQITGISNTQISYKPITGRSSDEWIYEIRDGQVIDTSSLTFGEYYYVIAEDIGQNSQYYVWTEAHNVPKSTATALYDAHISRSKITKTKYAPLPEHLKQAIIQLGRPAYNIWCQTVGQNGEEPSPATFDAAILIHKSELHKRDQKKLEIARHIQAVADLLEF